MIKEKPIKDDFLMAVMKEVKSTLDKDSIKHQEGWHWNFCGFCGKKYSRIKHYGGEKKLKSCVRCLEYPHYCFECYKKSGKI